MIFQRKGQLSAQSIARLCSEFKYVDRDAEELTLGFLRLKGFDKVADWLQKLNTQQPMIVPFVPEKLKQNGKSYGLSGASYDCRVEEDITLGVHPGVLLMQMMLNPSYRSYRAETILEFWRQKMATYPKWYSLSHTVEDFFMPHDVVGYVCDKSTYARVFVSAFNTLFDPGFQGNGTLELVNLGEQLVEYKAGDPVCQFAFHWLDRKTDRPYDGKYQHQSKAAHAARYELPGGGWTNDITEVDRAWQAIAKGEAKVPELPGVG